MATNTAGTTARVYHQAQRHYIDAVISVANLSPSLSFKMGTVPAGAAIVGVFQSVRTAFNAGTNNQFTLGTASGGAQLVAAASTNLTTIGSTSDTMVAGAVQAPTVDTDIWITGAFTGTAANAGDATVYVEYLVPDSSLA